MSEENLVRFMNKVTDSEELQAKIGEEIDTEALIALGAECGCEFTAEELQDSAELSDEELDGVAGGEISEAAVRVSSNGYFKLKGMLLDTATVPQLKQHARHGKRIKVNFNSLFSTGSITDY